MKRNLLPLTLLVAALSVGCASQPVVQSRGNLQEVVKQGTTYHLDVRRSGLDENELRGLRERLRKAGLSPASAETAKLLVTLSSELQSMTERRHTGGKNGVAYDHRTDERCLTLTVSENRPGAGQVLTERRHTGGKNGVAYDHRIGGRGLIMEVSSSDSGSIAPARLLSAALAALGD